MPVAVPVPVAEPFPVAVESPLPVPVVVAVVAVPVFVTVAEFSSLAVAKHSPSTTRSCRSSGPCGNMVAAAYQFCGHSVARSRRGARPSGRNEAAARPYDVYFSKTLDGATLGKSHHSDGAGEQSGLREGVKAGSVTKTLGVTAQASLVMDAPYDERAVARSSDGAACRKNAAKRVDWQMADRVASAAVFSVVVGGAVGKRVARTPAMSVMVVELSVSESVGPEVAGVVVDADEAAETAIAMDSRPAAIRWILAILVLEMEGWWKEKNIKN